MVGRVHLPERLDIADARAGLLPSYGIGEIVDLTDQRREGCCVAPEEEEPAIVFGTVVRLCVWDSSSCFVWRRGETISISKGTDSGNSRVESMIGVMKLVSKQRRKNTRSWSRWEGIVGGVEPMELLVCVPSVNPYSA